MTDLNHEKDQPENGPTVSGAFNERQEGSVAGDDGGFVIAIIALSIFVFLVFSAVLVLGFYHS
ncbi:MAG: hypothetical protein U5K75_12015 [Ahrensia sp.]|nr:hypothetical protein [Ahrensia sp.]